MKLCCSCRDGALFGLGAAPATWNTAVMEKNPENSCPRGSKGTAVTMSCSRVDLYFKPSKNCIIC